MNAVTGIWMNWQFDCVLYEGSSPGVKNSSQFASFNLCLCTNSVITAEKGQVFLLFLQETVDDLVILTVKAVGADIWCGILGCCNFWLVLDAAEGGEAAVQVPAQHAPGRGSTRGVMWSRGAAWAPVTMCKAGSLLIERRSRWFLALRECWLRRLWGRCCGFRQSVQWDVCDCKRSRTSATTILRLSLS